MTDMVFLDRDLLVSVKPSGLLSEGEGTDSFPFHLREALRKRGESETLYPVHRLDRETEGLMVWARTPKGAAALSKAIAEGKMKKEYLAVVCGSPDPKTGTLRDLLFYDRGRGKSFLVDRPRKGVKEAILDYRVLDFKQGYSLVRIALHTGRTHQIRVQFGGRGLPLCGDRRYGAPPSPYRMGLCSVLLSFPHPQDGREMVFTYTPNSEPPSEKQAPWALFSDLSDPRLDP